MSTSLPPPLPVGQAPQPVETLAYDSQPDNWVPSILRVFGWVAVIGGGANLLVALVQAGAQMIAGNGAGGLFDGQGRYGWTWGLSRVATWVASLLLVVTGILCLARARAARLVTLIWAFSAIALGAGHCVLGILYYIELGTQAGYDNAMIVSYSAQYFGWFFTASAFPAIVSIFMFTPATRRWFESR